jgi:hypothetical protein
MRVTEHSSQGKNEGMEHGGMLLPAEPCGSLIIRTAKVLASAGVACEVIIPRPQRQIRKKQDCTHFLLQAKLIHVG